MTISKKILTVLAIVGGMALVGVNSGFTKAPTGQAGPYFYEFVGNQASSLDVKSPTKYERFDAGCVETDGDLCGIYLPNDAAPNANPSPADFTPHETDLWSSAQSGSSQDPLIEMKN